jgi:uncharacterized protein (DUF983 family)
MTLHPENIVEPASQVETPTDVVPSAASPLMPAILTQRCPRCGNAPLFAGWVRFADRCRACGLDFTQFNVGDGPAAFLILIVGGLVVALALMLELNAHPPFWVHILLWVPLTTLLVIYCLRLSKAALLILEYRNQAREGRIAPEKAEDV